MCPGKCSRLVGLCLLAMGLASVVANLLLMFPNGESRWAANNRITSEVWMLGGLLGGGLLVLCTGCSVVRAGGKGCCGYGCCGNRCRMLHSVFCSAFGALGGLYCLSVSSSGLAKGPWCQTAAGEWMSPFKELSKNYLSNVTLWEECVEPPNVVLWNVVLFSVLLALGGLEMVLCGVQVVNGLLGTVCGDCRKAADRAGEGL